MQIGYTASGKNYPVQLSSEKMYVNVPWENTTVSTGITRTATTYVPGTTVEASLQQINKINIFSLATSSWVSNTETATKTDYPYVANISTTEYTNDSAPLWKLIGSGNVPTKSEQTQASKVPQAYFTASSITLYATSKPSVALRLLVKGV